MFLLLNTAVVLSKKHNVTPQVLSVIGAVGANGATIAMISDSFIFEGLPVYSTTWIVSLLARFPNYFDRGCSIENLKSYSVKWDSKKPPAWIILSLSGQEIYADMMEHLDCNN